MQKKKAQHYKSILYTHNAHKISKLIPVRVFTRRYHKCYKSVKKKIRLPVVPLSNIVGLQGIFCFNDKTIFVNTSLTSLTQRYFNKPLGFIYI